MSSRKIKARPSVHDPDTDLAQARKDMRHDDLVDQLAAAGFGAQVDSSEQGALRQASTDPANIWEFYGGGTEQRTVTTSKVEDDTSSTGVGQLNPPVYAGTSGFTAPTGMQAPSLSNSSNTSGASYNPVDAGGAGSAWFGGEEHVAEIMAQTYNIPPTPTVDPSTGHPLTQYALEAVAATTDTEAQNWSRLLGQPVDKLQAAKLGTVVGGVAVGSGAVGAALGFGFGAFIAWILTRNRN
jgi:hypothetical protein